MKNLIYFTVLFYLILSFSCSIQKRLYQPGYNIEWKTKADINKKSSETLAGKNQIDIDKNEIKTRKVKDEKLKIKNETSIENLFASKSNDNISLNKSKKNLISRKINVNKIAQHKNTEIKSLKNKNSKNQVTVLNENKNFTLSLLSFIFGILAIVTFIALIGGSAISDFLFIAVLIFFIAGLVLGIIGLNKSEKHPEKYSGKWMAIAGIAASGFTFILLITYTVLILFMLLSLI